MFDSFLNTEKRVEHKMHSEVFLANFEMFWEFTWSHTVLSVWYIFSIESKAI